MKIKLKKKKIKLQAGKTKNECAGTHKTESGEGRDGGKEICTAKGRIQTNWLKHNEY